MNSNQAQLPLQLDKVKEESSKPENGKLQLNQYKRFYYPKKKGKRCWKCKAWGNFKRNCPQIKCYYCDCQVHTKKRCFKRDLHLAIQALKKIKEDQEQEKENSKKKHQTLNDRCKEVEFRQEGKRWIMSCMKMDLIGLH